MKYAQKNKSREKRINSGFDFCMIFCINREYAIKSKCWRQYFTYVHFEILFVAILAHFIINAFYINPFFSFTFEFYIYITFMSFALNLFSLCMEMYKLFDS